MRDTFLVQRLMPPKPKTGHALDHAHRVFGGGMLGLNEHAWDLFDRFCVIDYMGSAEYEFGALPRSLAELAVDSHRLVTFEIAIPGKDIKLGWWRESKERMARRAEVKKAKADGRKPGRAKRSSVPADATIYIVCRPEHREGAEAAVRENAAGKLRTKGGTGLSESLDPNPGGDRLTVHPVGWYELDNGWFFFTDRAMCQAVCDLFEVPGAQSQNVAAG